MKLTTIESIDFQSLCDIGWSPELTRPLAEALRHGAALRPDGSAPAAATGLRPARVIEVQREGLRLHDGHEAFGARLLPSLRRTLEAEGDALAVGDWVLAGPDGPGPCWVSARLPPRNQIARRLHDGRDKVARAVIVANVDTVLLTMGLDHDFNLDRLERYVALVALAGAQAVVVLTKADLAADAPQRLAQVRARLPAAVPALAVNGLDPAAGRALAPWLQRGQTLALIGSSGAGKSTLTNALVGVAVQSTGPNRAGDSRGRHTTTVRTLHRTPQGGCIIDTPGLRTLRLDTDADRLGGAFADIGTLSRQCRFRNCRHEQEPGCAVRDALGDERLVTWRKLQRETRRDQMTMLERKAQHQAWKVRSRAARARAKAQGGAGAEGGPARRGGAVQAGNRQKPRPGTSRRPRRRAAGRPSASR